MTTLGSVIRLEVLDRGGTYHLLSPAEEAALRLLGFGDGNLPHFPGAIRGRFFGRRRAAYRTLCGEREGTAIRLAERAPVFGRGVADCTQCFLVAGHV